MRAKVQKWGNSAAIRLPAPVLEAAQLSVNQTVEIRPQDGGLFIRAVEALLAYSLDELLAEVTPANLNIDQQWADDPATGREVL